MLHFGAGVCCSVFRLEHALILHHAAAWSAIAGVAVLVNRLTPAGDTGPTERAVFLELDAGGNGKRRTHLAELHAYLTRSLSPEYVLRLDAVGLYVAWRGADQT